MNVSLDTMDSDKYKTITGGGDIQKVLRGIEAARQVGMTPIKINTVLIGGFNDNEIPDFVEMTREQPVELRFIELMPMGPRGGIWGQCLPAGADGAGSCAGAEASARRRRCGTALSAAGGSRTCGADQSFGAAISAAAATACA